MVSKKTKKNRYKKKQNGGINIMKTQNKSMFNRNTMNSNPYSNRNTIILNA